MSIIGIVILLFITLLFLGLPVTFVLGISSVAYCFLSGNLDFLYIISHNLFKGMDNFVLMAIPLFILTGEIMNQGTITTKLVHFANILVGRWRGGLAHVNVVGSMFFAGITGSALSDVAALGAMLIPAMERSGYDKEFSAAVTAASAIQGPIIPPSIPAVLIAAVTGTSTGALFLGGAIPGILLGLFCCLIVAILAKKRNYPQQKEKITLNLFIKALARSFLPLLTPLIILGGILLGVFTPTEAAAVSVVYALVLTTVAYRVFSWKKMKEVLVTTVLSTSKIYMIIGTASIFAWILSMENIPALAASFLASFAGNKITCLIIINLFLLFWGMWMDTAPSIMVLMPLLLPIASAIGIHPTHLGVIVILNLMIGLLTPPFGMALFSAQAVSNVSLKGLLKELWPFLLGHFLILMLVTFIPAISLFLPRLFGLIN